MSLHPCITVALAEQHRRDLIARADTYRLARAARSGPRVPPRQATGLVKGILRTMTAMQQAVVRLRRMVPHSAAAPNLSRPGTPTIS